MTNTNRALEGFSNEKDFVKKLNSNKNHRFWKILNLNDNKDLFFVKVEGKKFCKTTKENILQKSDVFIAKINIDRKKLEKKEFYIDENLSKQKLKIYKILNKKFVEVY